MNTGHLIAIDPSLTCSGWALFSLKSGRIKAIGKVRAMSAKHSMDVRLADLQAKVREIINSLKLGDGDLLVAESPTTMRDPKAAFKVEQVRGIFETLARESRLEVPGRVNPRTVHTEVLGLRGRQLGREHVKAMAADVAHRLYGAQLAKLGFEPEVGHLQKNQDIVDAILVGHLAISRIQSARQTETPVSQMFE